MTAASWTLSGVISRVDGLRGSYGFPGSSEIGRREETACITALETRLPVTAELLTHWTQAIAKVAEALATTFETIAPASDPEPTQERWALIVTCDAPFVASLSRVKHMAEGSEQLMPPTEPEIEVRGRKIRLITGDLIADDGSVRHDADKVARLLLEGVRTVSSAQALAESPDHA